MVWHRTKYSHLVAQSFARLLQAPIELERLERVRLAIGQTDALIHGSRHPFAKLPLHEVNFINRRGNHDVAQVEHLGGVLFGGFTNEAFYGREPGGHAKWAVGSLRTKDFPKIPFT